MTDVVDDVPPRAHARIVYLGPVSPHWEVYGDWGERTLLDEFRARVLARLVLLPRDDPQFRRNRERVIRTSPSNGTSAYPTGSSAHSRHRRSIRGRKARRAIMRRWSTTGSSTAS